MTPPSNEGKRSASRPTRWDVLPPGWWSVSGLARPGRPPLTSSVRRGLESHPPMGLSPRARRAGYRASSGGGAEPARPVRRHWDGRHRLVPVVWTGGLGPLVARPCDVPGRSAAALRAGPFPSRRRVLSSGGWVCDGSWVTVRPVRTSRVAASARAGVSASRAPRSPEAQAARESRRRYSTPYSSSVSRGGSAGRAWVTIGQRPCRRLCAALHGRHSPVGGAPSRGRCRADDLPAGCLPQGHRARQPRPRRAAHRPLGDRAVARVTAPSTSPTLSSLGRESLSIRTSLGVLVLNGRFSSGWSEDVEQDDVGGGADADVQDVRRPQPGGLSWWWRPRAARSACSGGRC